MDYSFRLRESLSSPVLLCLLLAAFIIPPQFAAAQDDDIFLGDYLDSPVFFETFWEEYYDTTNFELLPGDQIYLYPLGLRDISDFSWVNPEITKGARDYSWYLRIENMRYMVPFIKSTDPEHRTFLRDWFEEWFEHHKNLGKPNKAAWDLMTTAIRAMVFTYYLKQIDSQHYQNPHEPRSDEEQELMSHLRETLFDHQQHLAVPTNFDDNSNHGMWEAMGLFETTRVFPSDQIVELALDRANFIVEISVSSQGFHMEHSTAYHFFFLNWLQQYVTYLTSLEDFSWDGLQGLDDRLQAMLAAAYFLQDHDGNMPAIGDTDQCRVLDRFRFKTTTDEDGACFDESAGYAIYKDHTGSGLQRYAIFNIQSRHPKLPYHYHNDAIAFYYNCMGEVILGDQGRFEYGHSPERMYFSSNRAHNTAVPANLISGNVTELSHNISTSLRMAKNPAWQDGGDAISFSASLSYNLFSINRQVLIPKNEPVVEVVDSITGSKPAVILWHLGHDVESIERSESSADAGGVDHYHEWLLVTAKKRSYAMSISVSGQPDGKEFSVDIYEGCEDPMIAWYAPAYLVKLPVTLIAIRVNPAHRNLVRVVTRVAAIE